MSYFDGLLAALGPVDCEVIVDAEGYQMRPPNNLRAAWRALAQADARGDWLLFLEDDVRPLAPLSAAMAHEVAAGAAFASLCRAFGHPVGVRPGVLFMGSQAVLFPARTVRILAAFGRERPEALAGVIHFDMAISVICQHLAFSYEQAPAYFEHVGTTSAASPLLT